MWLTCYLMAERSNSLMTIWRRRQDRSWVQFPDVVYLALTSSYFFFKYIDEEELVLASSKTLLLL